MYCSLQSSGNLVTQEADDVPPGLLEYLVMLSWPLCLRAKLNLACHHHVMFSPYCHTLISTATGVHGGRRGRVRSDPEVTSLLDYTLGISQVSVVVTIKIEGRAPRMLSYSPNILKLLNATSQRLFILLIYFKNIKYLYLASCSNLRVECPSDLAEPRLNCAVAFPPQSLLLSLIHDNCPTSNHLHWDIYTQRYSQHFLLNGT